MMVAWRIMVVTINKFSILKLDRFTCFFIDYQLGTKDIFYVEGCQYWEYGGFCHSHPLAVTASQCKHPNDNPPSHSSDNSATQNNSQTPIIQMSHLIQGTKGDQLQIVLSHSPY